MLLDAKLKTIKQNKYRTHLACRKKFSFWCYFQEADFKEYDASKNGFGIFVAHEKGAYYRVACI